MSNSNADTARHGAPAVARRCLVTGGAGFIGCNLADSLVRRGWDVAVLDDLSRRGTDRNLEWLRSRSDGGIRFLRGDVRDAEAVARAVGDVDVVYHLAGQTAVTTSIRDPRADFEANALGSLNVLEAARSSPRQPVVVVASTNKVYGRLARLDVVEEQTRYRFRDLPEGVDETEPLDLHSPYACSKGAADQYALDYHRVFGIPTVVFRQSCVYGPRQLGSEDQGWVAWLVAAAALGRATTIFGTGKQVRDLLHVDDLVDAYLRATESIERTAGQAYNVGGGPGNSLSVWWELEPLLTAALGRSPATPAFEPARPGDQLVFVCDTRKAAADFGWKPGTGVEQGIGELAAWTLEHAEALGGAAAVS